MQIPRFYAQIQAIQVPSIKNYQEEENKSITESLAKFGSDLFSAALKLEEKMKLQQAEKDNVLFEETRKQAAEFAQERKRFGNG